MYIEFYPPLEQVRKCWEEGDSKEILDSLPEHDFDVWFLRLEESLQACGIPQDQWPSVATALLGGESKMRMERFVEKRNFVNGLEKFVHHAADVQADAAHKWGEFVSTVNKVSETHPLDELVHHAADVQADAARKWGEFVSTVSKVSETGSTGFKSTMNAIPADIGKEGAKKWEEFKSTLKKIADDAKKGLGPKFKDAINTVHAFYNDHPLVVAVTGWTLAIGVALSAHPLTIATLNALGFSTLGPVAGSVATGVQSMVYGGSTTGVFSLLQSISMTAAAPPAAIIMLVGFITVFGVMSAWGVYNHPTH